MPTVPTASTLSRRAALATLALGWPVAVEAGTSVRSAASGSTAPAGAANGWFPVRGDDGHPVPNNRAPVELVDEIEDLPGAIWAGPASGAVRLVEFFDYNCPWCRAAEAARTDIRRTRPDLRIGLVNNPILSKASLEAARVELALLKHAGAGATYRLHEALFATSGRIDGDRALAAAAAAGHPAATLSALAASPEIARQLEGQLALAASLGLSATPSYVVGGASVLGFPGPRSLAAMVDSANTCGLIAC